MTITFFEYGNSVTFNAHDILNELSVWEDAISNGDSVLYHDSVRSTRPLGKIISVSPDRKYLLVRLAGYERFVIMRKIKPNEYIVVKSDLSAMLETTGKLYYEGTVSLQNVYWGCGPEQQSCVVFLWYHNEDKKLFADVVTLSATTTDKEELIDYISGRYTLSN